MQTIFERDGPTVKEVEDALSICDAIPEWIGDGDKDYESFHVADIRNCARVLKYFKDEIERQSEQIRQMNLTHNQQAEAINWLYIEKEQLEEQLAEVNKKD